MNFFCSILIEYFLTCIYYMQLASTRISIQVGDTPFVVILLVSELDRDIKLDDNLSSEQFRYHNQSYKGFSNTSFCRLGERIAPKGLSFYR